MLSVSKDNLLHSKNGFSDGIGSEIGVLAFGKKLELIGWLAES